MTRVCLLLLATLALPACARAYTGPQVFQPDVAATEGDTVTLRCLIRGKQPSDVTWMSSALRTVDGNAGRYRVMPDGALVINPVHRSDAGVFICVSDNGYGNMQKIQLFVNALRTRNVACKSRDGRPCHEGPGPTTNQSCSPGTCPALWIEGPWGDCSQRCGTGGVRSREVTCQKINAHGIESVVPDKECFAQLGPKPEMFQKCNEDVPCPTWFVGHWSPCDKLCDEGRQTRKVVCHQKNNGRVEVLEDENCTEEKPTVEQPCMLEPCHGVDWVASSWYGCDSCTSKIRTRTVICSTGNNQAMNESFCSHISRPADHEACDYHKLPSCDVHWYSSQWSKCSVSCGDGVQTRKVFCGMYYRDDSGEGMKKVEDGHCAHLTKYRDTKPCTVPLEKCHSQMFAGPRSWVLLQA